MVARMRAAEARERDMRAKLNLILAEVQGRQPDQAPPAQTPKRLAPAAGARALCFVQLCMPCNT